MSNQADSDRAIRIPRSFAGAGLSQVRLFWSALIILFIPMLRFMDISQIAPYAGIALSVWDSGQLVGRSESSGTPLTAQALIGIVATIIYVGLCMTNPDGGIASVVAMYGPVCLSLVTDSDRRNARVPGSTVQVKNRESEAMQRHITADFVWHDAQRLMRRSGLFPHPAMLRRSAVVSSLLEFFEALAAGQRRNSKNRVTNIHRAPAPAATAITLVIP
jgi:hypothetical protein